jgi:UDP-N-acetylglucosamine 2-epimerase (non-hydrolysing)
MQSLKVLAVLGTRPEAIKMGPVITKFGCYSGEIDIKVAVTGQHRSMLDQILGLFDIKPDFDLNIMHRNQSLTDVTVRSLRGLEGILRDEHFDLVIVQGDTTTAFVGALAAYYHQVLIAHVEAGLRTYDKYNPFPEEANRIFIDALADLCLAPTKSSEAALLAEQVDKNRIFVTGNTVIDALLSTAKADYQFSSPSLKVIDFDDRQTLLVTIHRRENHGEPLQTICDALRELASIRSDIQIIIPVHLNPNVHNVVHANLGSLETVYLVEPLDYPDFVNLMARSFIVLTDSGGVQEEAPSLKKPVLIMRATTERPEAITAGAARLVGTQKDTIISEVLRLLHNVEVYQAMAHAGNPYGDGFASERIVQIVRNRFALSSSKPDEFVAV